MINTATIQGKTTFSPEVTNIWKEIMNVKREKDKKMEEMRKEEELIKFRSYLYSIGKYDLEAGAVLE
jgi:hypothetical protein